MVFFLHTPVSAHFVLSFSLRVSSSPSVKGSNSSSIFGNSRWFNPATNCTTQIALRQGFPCLDDIIYSLAPGNC